VAVIAYSGSDNKVLNGTSGKDRFVVDLAQLADHRARLIDFGGADTLQIVDLGAEWATRSFMMVGDRLVWRGLDGGVIVIKLQAGLPQVEYLEWSSSTGSALHRLKLVTDLTPDTGGNIAILGTRGDDLIIVPDMGGDASGRSEVHGGGGADTITASGVEFSVVYGGGGNDLIVTPGPAAGEFHGGRHDDVLWGCAGDDRLFGDRGRDTLLGAAGDDLLKGGKGYDTLNGGAGDDVLRGGKGRDTLTGGAGADVFVFGNAQKEGVDKITDFEDGVDVLRIKGSSFGALDISQEGIDTHIILPNGTEIILQGIEQSLIDSADFVF